MTISQKLPAMSVNEQLIGKSPVDAGVKSQPVIQSGSDEIESSVTEISEKKPLSWKELIDLSSIDFNSIKAGMLHISIPFKAGTYQFPGHYEDAVVKVKKRTHALLSIAISQNEKNESVMEGASLEFNPPLLIKNPASAFDHTHYLADKFKDLLANLILRGFAVSQKGEISLDGSISKGPFGQEDIRPEDMRRLSSLKEIKQLFPSDMKLKSLLGNFTNCNSSNSGEFFNILKRIGMMTEQIQYRLSLKTSPVSVGVHYKECHAWTQKSEADIDFKGSAHITSSGDIELTGNQSESYISADGVKMHVGGEGIISNLEKGAPTILAHVGWKTDVAKIEGEVLSKDEATATKKQIPFTVGGADNAISGHAFVNIDNKGSMKLNDASSLGIRMQARLPEQFYAQLGSANFQVGSNELFMKAGLNLESDKTLKINAGEALLMGKVQDVNVQAFGMRGIIEGNFGIGIQANHIKMNENQEYPSFDGEVGYVLTPEAASSKDIPRFDKAKQKLDYHFKSKDELSLESHESGLTQMVSPLTDLLASPEKISDPKTLPAGPIGSLAWRAKMEEVTSAPIRKCRHAELLIDGETSYSKKLEMIRNAKESIYVQALSFKDDNMGMEVAKALVEAKDRGVAVYVIVDSLGNIDSIQEFLKGNRVYRLFENNHVQFKLYNGGLEQGLRELIEVVATNEKLQEKMTACMSDTSKIMDTFHSVVEAAKGDLDIGLRDAEKQKLQGALGKIWGGKKGISSKEALEQLSNLTADSDIHLSEVAQIIGQLADFNHRWHEKYFIVDGKQAIMGSMNIGDPKTKEIEVLFEGALAVQDASRHFMSNWEIASGEKLSAIENLSIDSTLENQDTIDIQVVHGRPRIEGDHHVVDLLVESIKALQPGEKFYSAVAYFLPTATFEPYTEALIDAAKRGVDVRILTNSQESIDLPSVIKAARSVSYRRLLRGGVRLFACSENKLLHTKATAVGSSVAIVGSANANNRSGSLDSESVTIIHNEKFAKELESILLSEMSENKAQEIHLKDIEYGLPKEQIENAVYALLKDCM